MLNAILLSLHLLAAILWVGGMLSMHFVVRPALGNLEPAQRLPLMLRMLEIFFRWVSVAVLLILASGAAMLPTFGPRLPPYLHMMAASGVLMSLIFAWLRLRELPRLRAAVAATNWPAGAAVMQRIRRLVGVNLVLGLLTVLLPAFGHALN